MKMVAPAEIGHFEFDNIVYKRDEDGTFTINHPDHVASALIHGAKEFDPSAPHLGVFAAEPVRIMGFDDELREAEQRANAAEADSVAKDGRIAELERLLAEAQTTRDAPAPGGDGAGDATERTDDTSGGAGAMDVEQETARRAALLAKKPDTDNYDEMKSWLTEAGVAFPGNVSKARAKEIVEETIAELEKPVAAE